MSSTAPAGSRAGLPRPPLARPRTCAVSGVSVALADHLGWPVAAVRWAFVGATFLGGAGILLYLWLWAFTPLRAPSGLDPADGVRRRVNLPWLLAGAGAAAGITAVVLAAGGALGPGFGALVACAALLVLAVAWEQLADEEPVAFAPLSPAAFRIVCGAFLVLVALAIALTQNVAGSGMLWLGILIATFAGAAVLVAPWGLRLWRELITERTARIKEEQRAEMAAHLHDSVLQTLALIQNRAGPSSEVGRIARAQERELREWLFTEGAAASGAEERDLAAELREVAAALEVEHPVTFDVVSVGEPVRNAPSELGAAAREAMLNAARHAGGAVSVYVEHASGRVDVFIRDRGPGFDLGALPEGRLGVRESIIGRMRRAGGQATVTARETGTEIQLTIDIANEAA
ncbi:MULTISPECIES: ATP-binding protein [unclassified Leifsonia]|uniref:ATP-binding protein n=1 Tax=unclassified Leifsonia TaxID=2663824 RepID=UPI00035E9FD1|nr:MULTISPECIES: ATP-binding protein [unclassified Leifsonia]TDQ02554.1 phage shock protein C (PspC) family protein [Leifsonia sp. 115AMFTsu3.1]